MSYRKYVVTEYGDEPSFDENTDIGFNTILAARQELSNGHGDVIWELKGDVYRVREVSSLISAEAPEPKRYRVEVRSAELAQLAEKCIAYAGIVSFDHTGTLVLEFDATTEQDNYDTLEAIKDEFKGSHFFGCYSPTLENVREVDE
jgi:hypothetical protein